jgi:hypothetical protein
MSLVHSCTGVVQARSLAWLRGVALACAAIFIGIPASQASASASPIYRTPDVCNVALAAQASADRFAAASARSLAEFCGQISVTGARANAVADKYFTAAERRRVRRVLDSVARRYVPAQQPAIRAITGAVTPVAAFAFDLGDVKDFAKKSLKKLKKVSGRLGKAFKLLPQARLLRCGVFATLGGAQSWLQGDQVRTVLLEAGGACVTSLVGDYLSGLKYFKNHP